MFGSTFSVSFVLTRCRPVGGGGFEVVVCIVLITALTALNGCLEVAAEFKWNKDVACEVP